MEGWREAGRDVALSFFGDVQGLAIQGSCFKGVQPITSALAPPNSKTMGFYLLFQISPPCKVLVTLTLCTLGSPPPKSSVFPYAAGERGSSPRLALNSPESSLGFQTGSWGTGVLVPVRGFQATVAPSTSLGCAWLPSPSAALLHVSSEECTQLKFLRDLFLLAGKRLGQLPLPVAKEAVEKTGGPP